MTAATAVVQNTGEGKTFLEMNWKLNMMPTNESTNDVGYRIPRGAGSTDTRDTTDLTGAVGSTTLDCRIFTPPTRSINVSVVHGTKQARMAWDSRAIRTYMLFSHLLLDARPDIDSCTSSRPRNAPPSFLDARELAEKGHQYTEDEGVTSLCCCRCCRAKHLALSPTTQPWGDVMELALFIAVVQLWYVRLGG